MVLRGGNNSEQLVSVHLSRARLERDRARPPDNCLLHFSASAANHRRWIELEAEKLMSRAASSSTRPGRDCRSRASLAAALLLLSLPHGRVKSCSNTPRDYY